MTTLSIKRWVGAFMLSIPFMVSYGYDCTASFSYTDNGSGNYTFTAHTSGHYPGTYYSWIIEPNNSFYGGSSTQHQFTENGSFKATLITFYAEKDSANGPPLICTDTTFQIIQVTTAPVITCKAHFKMFTKDSTSNNKTWYITNGSVGDNGATYTCKWDFGDGNVSYDMNPTHTYAVAGHYDVCLTITTSNNCTDTYCDTSSVHKMMAGGGDMKYLVVLNNTTGGIDNAANQMSMRAFPNPFSSQIDLKFNSSVSQQVNIQVSDVTGKLIYSENKAVTNGNNELKIDGSSFSQGMYFVKMYLENGKLSSTIKVVK